MVMHGGLRVIWAKHDSRTKERVGRAPLLQSQSKPITIGREHPAPVQRKRNVIQIAIRTTDQELNLSWTGAS